MSLYRIKVLFKLGIEDLTKNMNVFIYILIPLGFALLYANMGMGEDPNYLMQLCMMLNMAMVPVALMSTIIAEEKEKNTLRTLTLNNVKGTEILFAKALICLLFIVVNNILMSAIIGIPKEHFLATQIIGLFVGLAIIFFGAIVGLLAKNQMSAGLLSLPFMLVFMAPIFTSMIGDVADKIAQIIPTDAMVTLINDVYTNTFSIQNSLVPIIVIAVWLILGIIIFNLMYKKIGVDN